MKKLLVTFVVVLFSAGAFAQVGAGIKAGVNFANQSITSSGDFDAQSRTGYHFGAFFTFNFSENVALQPEILFSQQGSEITYNSVTSDVDYSYLTIPVLLKFKVLGVINLHAGPQFNILSNAELENQLDDVKDDLRSTDFSLALGGGINLPAGLTAGLRYVIGLQDINEGDFGGLSNDAEIKNQLLQIYVGYRLFGE